MSASRPPLSSRPAFLPDEIARREFASTFRGYDPAEVRTFLNQLSEQSAELADRIAELNRSLADTQARVNSPELDEETVTKLLGEQTAQILRSAREAANQTRASAEEEVSRSLREAHEVSTRMRTEAETILRDRTEEAQSKAEQVRAEADGAATALRADAQSDALTMRREAEQDAERLRMEVAEEAQNARADLQVELERREAEHKAQMEQELETSRQRAREMVEAARAESQSLVDRTAAEQEEKLETLIRKRKIALAQVEELRAGRQRLLKAYKMVRGTLDEVTQELTRVEDEARQAAGIAGVTAAQSSNIAQEELDTVVELEQYSLNDDVPQAVIDLINGEETDESASEPASQSGEEVVEDQIVDVDLDEEDETTRAGGADFFDGESAYEDEEHVDLRSKEERTSSGEDLPGTRQPSGAFEARTFVAPTESAQAPTTVATMARQDEIAVVDSSEQTYDFKDQQLDAFADETQAAPRAASSFIIGESFATENAQMDRNVALRRDSVVTKNCPQAVRRLKRALQDEQDAVVSQLRSGKITSVAGLLGSVDDQATTYQRAIVRLFREVVRAGASSVEGSTGVEPGSIDHTGTNAARFMALELAQDLRSQLEPVLEDLVGGSEMPDAGTVQALVAGPYGVVKGDYLEHLVDDRIGGAFDQGVAFAR